MFIGTFSVLLVCALWSSVEGDTRYLLYSVNPGEGFNLRRDVHMRAATLVKRLREKEDWVLVLPPWPHLYHWKSRFEQSGIPWSMFFDLPSLNEYVPSIEFDEYLKREGHVIDEVMHMQEFAEGWGERWVEKMEDRPCISLPRFVRTSSGHLRMNVFGHEDIDVRSFRCVSVQGNAAILVPELQERKTNLKSVLVTRFETLLHTVFGGIDYWAARKSMVYARRLRETGNQFMREKLDYDPGRGKGRHRPRNGGGRFMSVHMRRQDYASAHPDFVPSLNGVANQISRLKMELGLKTVFLATDATTREKKRLKKMVDGLFWYEPSENDIIRYGDGGVAIIDQWIASHSRYFIGTSESTFSFRIREDRQFMEFSKESTFNDLCGPSANENDPHGCEKPTYRKMVEPPSSPAHEEL